MGGKPWNEQEEQVFWQLIARMAPPGLDADRRRVQRRAEQARNWDKLAPSMKTLMRVATRGAPPRRNYNGIVLYEHLHHNYHRNKGVAKGKYSPHARKYVKEYEEWLEKNGGGASDGSSNASTTPQLAAQPARLQQNSQHIQIQPQAHAYSYVQPQHLVQPQPIGQPQNHVQPQQYVQSQRYVQPQHHIQPQHYMQPQPHI